MKTKATKKSKVQAVADRFNAAGPPVSVGTLSFPRLSGHYLKGG